METYIYKMIALSAIFILLYFVFLEKEKNHHFKRFYLLLSMLFSVLIPLISITYGEIRIEKHTIVNHQEIIILPETKWVEFSVYTIENILLGIYLLGLTILLLKFSWGIFKLIKEIKTSEKIKQNNFTFILKQNKITPYSFWNCIFLNKKDFLDGKIDAKIILHEKTHINQKHSIDVLFIELLLCVFWFNPAFYFYKKAMVTNHEFLADEVVLSQNNDIVSYQKLILDELISEKILFTHPFNLHNTKKRIVMMTNKLTKIAKMKSYLTLPISALLFFAFVEKVPAKIATEKNGLISKKISVTKNEILSETTPVITSQIPVKDTIKPKVQQTENIAKENKENKRLVGGKSKSIETIPPPPPVEKIESQTQAEFPGGNAALRQKFIENFDSSKLQNKKGMFKGTINFIISEDGKSYNASYDFDDEDFKKVAKTAMEKTLKGVDWKPGTLNGKPVASQFKMPITMNFE